MSISPAVRLVTLFSVYLVIFFSIITFIITLASESVSLNNIRTEASKEFVDRNSHRDEATKKLNEELMVKSSTETMIRINNDELIKVRNLKTEDSSQKPATQNQPSQAIIAR